MKKREKRDTKNLDSVKWIILGVILIVTVFFFLKLTGFSVVGGTCVDSDNGMYPYIRGSVSGLNSVGVPYQLNDSCMKSVSQGDYVVERKCTTNNDISYSTSFSFTCLYGCANGACLTKSISSSITPPPYSETNIPDSTTPPSYSETEVISPTNTDLFCSNSDGGKTPTLNGNLSIYYSNGTLKNYFLESCMVPSDKNFSDLLSPHIKNESCSGRGCMLEEFYCTGLRGEEKRVYTFFNYYCPSGCIGGACINYNDTTCTDTDLGTDYYTFGIVNSNPPYQSYAIDYCLNNIVLMERDCVNGAYSNHTFSCPYGCANGKCLITPDTKPPVPAATSWTGTGCSSCPNSYVVHNFGAMKKCVVKFNQLGAYLRDDGAWSYWGGTNMALCEEKINAGCSRKCGIGGWRCCAGATIWKWESVQWRIKNK